MTKTLDKLSSVVHQTVQPLEEKLAQALILQQKQMELESSAHFLSQTDINNLQEKTSQKVQVAISLNTSIQELRKDAGLLPRKEVERLTILKECLMSICNVHIKLP